MTEPRVVCLLSWYDERCDWLDKAITSLAKVPVDHVVAIDGAFALFPDGTPDSPPEQHEAIRKACAEHDMGCTIHIPETVWPTHVDKLCKMFELGLEQAEPNVDWLLVWDADQVFGKCELVKPRLAATDLDVAETMFYERPNPEDKPRVPGALIQPPTTFRIRNLFRAIPGTYVKGNHYTYLTGDGRYLWGNVSTDPLVPSLDLTDVRVIHKTYQRDPARRARSVAYYDARDSSKIELKDCNDCDRPATCTVHVDWEWHPDGSKRLVAGSIQACNRCASRRRAKEVRNMRNLGIDPNSAVKWMGYAHVAS